MAVAVDQPRTVAPELFPNRVTTSGDGEVWTAGMPISPTAVSSHDPATEIANGQELLKTGAISQQEFDALKAKALA